MLAINRFLNRVSMYRLMLYYLSLLIVIAFGLALFGVLDINPLFLLGQCIILLLTSYVFNQIFAALFRVKPNFESQFITALILTIIIGPVNPLTHLPLLLLGPMAAMGSKYLIASGKRHLFNPAGFGVFFTAILVGMGASWWIGTTTMMPFIWLGGLIVARKIGRGGLITTFLGVYLALFALTIALQQGFSQALGNSLVHIMTGSSLPFFAFVMLVEPLTSPATARYRIYYGIITAALLMLYQTYLVTFPYTLELALLSGNIFTWLLGGQVRHTFILKNQEQLAPDITAFHFDPIKSCPYTPGQFLEWTLPHPHPDSRGTRRFFTIASSPTEDEILLTTRIGEKSSSFKTALRALKPGEQIIAGSVSGEFILPKSRDIPCVFIAGGIGITPFRSMIKYLLDAKEKQPITLFYSARTAKELVFRSLFTLAEKQIGLKTVYTITDDVPTDWDGETGFIDANMIKKHVPDYEKQLFYVSGPEPMVKALESMLLELGIKRSNMKHDYFPGYEDPKNERPS